MEEVYNSRSVRLHLPRAGTRGSGRPRRDGLSAWLAVNLSGEQETVTLLSSAGSANCYIIVSGNGYRDAIV